MSGNGVDLGAIYQLLTALASDVHESRLETARLRDEVAGLRAEVAGLRQEVAALRREVAGKADRDDVVRLRQTVVEYHSAVIGHGVLISELDDRLRRVEQHLGFSSVV